MHTAFDFDAHTYLFVRRTAFTVSTTPRTTIRPNSLICNMDVTHMVLQIRLFGLMVVLGVVDTVKAVLRTNKYVCDMVTSILQITDCLQTGQVNPVRDLLRE